MKLLHLIHYAFIFFFIIMETKAGNQNVRFFHPRWVPMDTGKKASTLIPVEIINRLSE